LTEVSRTSTQGCRCELAYGYERASSTMLTGVSVARREIISTSMQRLTELAAGL
jgi:hypothetical protein